MYNCNFSDVNAVIIRAFRVNTYIHVCTFQNIGNEITFYTTQFYDKLVREEIPNFSKTKDLFLTSEETVDGKSKYAKFILKNEEEFYVFDIK